MIINSIEEFDEWKTSIPNTTKHKIFRGQIYNWPLLPSICREIDKKLLEKKERQLLTEFKLAAKPCLHKVPNNDWDWLVVAQHHGLPTRLLDWTTDAYTALWFAVNKIDEKQNKPEVWVMKPFSTDFIDVRELYRSQPFSGSRTKIFETSFNIPRVNAQKGCFVLMKYLENSKHGFIPLDSNKLLKERLQRVFINPSKANVILKNLERKGFTKERMFPDIDEVAKQVKSKILGINDKLSC